MKKILALLLAVVFCLGIVAACGGGTDTPDNTPAPTPQPDPPTPPPVVDDVHDDYPRWTLSGADQFNISIAQITNQTPPSPDNRLSARLKDELGVTMDYELVPNDMQDERVGVLIAGGILPDILGFTQQECRLTHAGAKLKLDDHLATGVYENIYNHVAPVWGTLMWRGGGVENGLYTLPNYNRWYAAEDGTVNAGHDVWGMGWAVQKEVLAWAGYPDVKHITPQECFQMIADYMEEFPTIDGQPTIGFTIPISAQAWSLGNSPNFLAGFPNDGGVSVDSATGEAKIYANSQSAHDWFKLLNEMWHKGVIDPEFHTQTPDQWMEKIANGRLLAMHHQRWSWGAGHDALMDAGKENRTYVLIAPIWDNVANPWYLDVDVMNVNQGWSVATTSPEPERILTFMDVMLSEYWQIIMQWGEEGEDYFVNADGSFYRNQEQRDRSTDLMFQQENRLMALLDQMPKIQGNYPVNGNATAPGLDAGEWQGGLREFDRDFIQAYDLPNWRAFLFPTQEQNPPWFPAWQAPLGDGTAADVANTQMEEWQQEMLPKVIMAAEGEFDGLWEEYLAEFDRIDVAAYEAAVTEFTQRKMREAAGEE